MLEIVDAKALTRTEAEDLNFLNVSGWQILRRMPGSSVLLRQCLRVYSASVERDEERLKPLIGMAPELNRVENRIGRAIRTIAVFDPWYAFARSVGRFGRWLSVLAAVIAVFVVAGWRQFDLIGGIIAVGGALIVVAALRFIDSFYVTWRLRTLYSAAWLIVVIALASLFARRDLAAPAFAGAELFLLLQAIFAAIAYTIYTATTRFKTTRYPEHEIVQSLIAAGSRALNDNSYRRSNDRARMVADLEWVALRFERDFVGRFRLGDSATDAWFRQRGAECAAAIRNCEKDVAFPIEGVPAKTVGFILECLTSAARSSWGSFPRVPAATAPPRKRVVDFVRAAGTILIPAVVAIALFVGTRAFGGDNQLADKLLYVGLGFSFLSLLANIDPQRFDAQVGAARALGEAAKR